MTTAKLPLALAALAAAFSVVGCGGSTDASTGAPDMGQLGGEDTRGTQKVTIRTHDPAEVVYFQDGNGKWEKLAASGAQLFKGIVRDPLGRYGVAIGIPSYDTSAVYQLTTGETTSVDLRRGGAFVRRTFSGNIANFNPATQALKVASKNSGQSFYTNTYSHQAQTPGDFFVQTYAKSETTSSTDPLGPAKYMIRRALTGNSHINLNLNGPDFAAMDVFSVDTSGLSATVDGFSASVRLDGNSYGDLPTRLEPGTASFSAPPLSALNGTQDGFSIALTTSDAGAQAYRSTRYIVNQPGGTLPVIDFAPLVTASLSTDPSGWKVDFTEDPAYQCYSLGITGQRSVEVVLSRGWVTSGGVTSYTCPPLGTQQAFKKSFAGVKDRLNFTAYKSDYPIVTAMMASTGGYMPPVLSPTTSGAFLQYQTLMTWDRL